jgi:hypothetical protein
MWNRFKTICSQGNEISQAAYEAMRKHASFTETSIVDQVRIGIAKMLVGGTGVVSGG